LAGPGNAAVIERLERRDGKHESNAFGLVQIEAEAVREGNFIVDEPVQTIWLLKRRRAADTEYERRRSWKL
jgi:hypothetical protein